MAEELNAGAAPEAETPAPVMPEKKQRKPRAKKAEAITTSEVAKKNRGGRPKRAQSETTAKAADGRTVDGKRTNSRRATSTSRRGMNAKPANTALPRFDDLSELLQLEEENQLLRKELAEKLRQENASLRQRLGK